MELVCCGHQTSNIGSLGRLGAFVLPPASGGTTMVGSNILT